MPMHGRSKTDVTEHTAALTDLVLSSKVESLVMDIQDRAALIVKHEFIVPPNISKTVFFRKVRKSIKVRKRG